MESKISQTVSRKLAEPKKSGTPSNMISDYERGKRRLSPEMAERIAEILDIKADRIS
jgi:transcriptional regulator with XRE-family HTH domain